MSQAKGLSRAVATQLLKALQDSKEHHNFCGWGDAWERECAKEQKLEAQIDAAIEAAEKELS